MEPLLEGVAPMSARWVAILRGESALALTPRVGRRIFGLMPSAARCKFYNAPFKGRYAGAVKTIGYTPSRKNPRICARCIEHAPEGGAIVPVAVLFADVHGYTALCEQLEPREVASLVQTLYETSSSALLAQEGLLGQIAGDEIEGIFVPGLAGSNYRRKAVEAARSLMRGRHGHDCDQPITRAEPLEEQLVDWISGFQPDEELRPRFSRRFAAPPTAPTAMQRAGASSWGS